MEAIAIGVSDRNYQRSLDPLPPWETERSTSRSSVSRRFVRLSKKMLGDWMSRSLEDFDVRVVMIDGLWIKNHCLLIALGIAADGSKQVLGVREGSTERAAVVRTVEAAGVDVTPTTLHPDLELPTEPVRILDLANRVAGR